MRQRDLVATSIHFEMNFKHFHFADTSETFMRKQSTREPKKKICMLCRDKEWDIDYKDTGMLRKFLSDRGKIRSRRISGNCRQHQRDVAVAVKNAREMALLPYNPIGGQKTLKPRGM